MCVGVGLFMRVRVSVSDWISAYVCVSRGVCERECV